ASPSFNVIVLGMLLTLFPWYLAALKVATALVMVLVVVPYLSRKADLPGWRKPVEEPARVPGLRVFQWFQSGFARLSQSLLTPAGDAPRTVFHAVPWVVIRYAKNLLTVILISLPLMILAGLFGAALVELLPWTRVAGIAAGSAAGLFNRWHDLRTIAAAAAFLDRVPAPKPAPLILPTGRTSAELRGLAPALPQPRRVGGDRSVELWSAPFLPRGAKAGGKPFTRIEGADLGFERLPLPRPYQLMEPGPMHLGGLAAGDVNGDGWPDVVVGTHFGVQLYANVGGRFALQQIDFPPMKEWIVSVVA